MLITDCQCQSCPSAYTPRRASCPSTCTPDIILISALRKRRRQLSSYKKKCMEVLTFILSNSWLINGRGSFAKQSLGYKVTLTLLTSKCKQWRLCGMIPTISAVARWFSIDRKCLREWDKNYDKLLAACFCNDKKRRNGQLGKRVHVRGYELSYFLLSTTNLLYCNVKKQLLENTHYTAHYGLV